MALPLQGIRVLDLTIFIAGPVCTALLAEMGAEVIKVENLNARLGAGGVGLPMKPGVQEDRPYNRQPFFHQLNRGKKAISLNLMRPEAKEVVRSLVRLSDIVVENFSPRVMPNFSFQYEALRALNPGIIMISMPALGSTGPLSNRISLGPGIDAMSGLQHLTGFPEDSPMKPGGIIGDYNAGMIATGSLLTALYARRSTGLGQHIEVAMREGETFLIGEYVLEAAMNHSSPMRTGNHHPSMAPHNIYPCKGDEEWVTIAVGSDAQWQGLRHALGEPAWAQDSRCNDLLGRQRHQAEIDQHLAAWTGTQSALQVMELLQKAGVPSGVVMNARDMAESPHFQARGFTHTVETNEAGPMHIARPGFLLTRAPALPMPAPDFAEHTDYVFGELLGYTPEEIRRLEEVRATSRVPINLERD
ncbi:MAG: CoA transferase [Chloroflexi bacterium]|nr:CoA transferase [Chloroflexota bacterium]